MTEPSRTPPKQDTDRVQAFYDAYVDREWTRAERHRTEFAVTWKAITDHLAARRSAGTDRTGAAAAARPLRIIDIGAGPGRYSLLLSQAGHEVTLVDLSPASVEFSRKVTGGRLAGYLCGSATDLGAFADESFDAALLMGPLYHLLSEADRRRSVSEARRVIVPGGLLFASFISVYAEPNSGFIDAYFIHPSGVTPFMESEGLETLTVLAVEGVASMIEDNVNALQGALWDYWVEVNYRLAADPSLHGGAEHLLYVGRRKGPDSGGGGKKPG